jgi:enoyl-CoA hydratase/carnithine racemase
VIHRELEQEIGILRLDRPPVNALDLELLEEIDDALREAEASSAHAFILTGAGPAFSAGADLFSVLEEGPEYVEPASRALPAVFSRLFQFPRPVVAALNGHAIAGGAILTWASDYRIAADADLRIGVTELAVGVPYPTWALEIVRFAVPPPVIQEVVYLARNYPPRVALEKGLIDEVAEPAALMDRSMEVAERLARIPIETFSLTKRALRAPTVERVAAASPRDDPEVSRLWGSDQIRDSIRTFLRKTFGTDERQ